jgi:peroxisomal 2,4-dienoyl-CoA reductase
MSVYRSDMLAGQVALVTGGGTGICRGITEALLAHGADVVITSRNAERLQAAADEMAAASGRRCIPLAADVRDLPAVEGVITRTLEALGRLDIVVNGAAGNFLAPAASLSSNAFRTVLEIDTLGTFHVCKAAFNGWMKRNGGSIINVSATLHYTGVPLQMLPGAAKAAIDAMTRHLAFEWGPSGVRINSLAPGPIGDTEGMKRLLPEPMKEKLRKKIPLQRFGTVADVADAALYLASDAARYVTGSVLVVDGGAWMIGAPFDLG